MNASADICRIKEFIGLKLIFVLSYYYVHVIFKVYLIITMIGRETKLIKTFDVLFGNFIHQVAPLSHAKYSGYKSSLASVLGSWLLSSLALLPLGLSLLHAPPSLPPHPSPSTGNDVIVVEDICAVTLTTDDAVALSLAAFLFPAALTATGSTAILVSIRRRGRDVTGCVDKSKMVALDFGLDTLVYAVYYQYFTVYMYMYIQLSKYCK